MRYVIEYDSGPAPKVGPFDSREQAEAWADRYVTEYRAIRGPQGPGLVWNVSSVVEPNALEWWT
jgi:hypothetical protein